MTSTDSGAMQRQRVRRPRKPAKTNPLRSPRTGRAIFIVMCLVATGYAFASARAVD